MSQSQLHKEFHERFEDFCSRELDMTYAQPFQLEAKERPNGASNRGNNDSKQAPLMTSIAQMCLSNLEKRSTADLCLATRASEQFKH